MLDSALKPLPEKLFDYNAAAHLLNRAGFGGTPAQARALADMGLNKAVDQLVKYETQPNEPVKADLFDHEIMSPPTDEQRETARKARQSNDEEALAALQRERQRAQGLDRKQIAELQKWWIKRMIETPRPLEEKMTLFYHGHFATGYRTIEDSFHMYQQNQLFRKFATGNFAQLAHRIIRDPAMLKYLDNDENRKSSPNENLARELMELFTLGEGRGYTEADIKAGALALTGYTFKTTHFNSTRTIMTHRPKTSWGKAVHLMATDFLMSFWRATSAPNSWLESCSSFLSTTSQANLPKSRRRSLWPWPTNCAPVNLSLNRCLTRFFQAPTSTARTTVAPS